MERMTIRGDHGVYMAPGWDFRIDSDDYELVQKVLDRFAAYEDTCLAPEDITKPFGEETILKLAASVFGMAPDRLRELAKADQEGQCVVTEFVPGNEVWVVERDEDGAAVDFSGMIFVTSVNCVAILSPTINECAELNFILSDFVEETAMSGSGDFSGYPIWDCYGTREEAEAAVAKIVTSTEEGERPDSVEKGRNG